MARMDVSATTNKQRRSLPRILSSSKNFSLTDTSYIKDHFDVPDEDHRTSISPSQQLLDQNEKYEESINAVLIQNASKTKEEPQAAEQAEQAEEGLEIQVNKMITIRKGPQLYVPKRRLRCAPVTNATTENSDTLKTLTPNELLFALVNLFAPPMGGDENPPVLDREYVATEDPHSTFPPHDTSTSAKRNVFVTSGRNEESKELKTPKVETPMTWPQMSDNRIMPNSGSSIPRFSYASDRKSTDSASTKYPPTTLGGALGLRRTRNATNQSANNNLTLDQLNPTLAEALAAMKMKSGGASKSGNQGNSADGYSNRRDSLPTRMSGPVTLEALASSNSTCADGSAPTSGHLVSFNGQTTEVPEEIHCHLCDYPMKLCIRKSKYKGEIREYAAYRCLRKGCQTFRSVRKVIEPDFASSRKRKHEESSAEIFDACGVSPGSGASSAKKRYDSDLKATNGTLLFLPAKVTPKHMEAMQKFTFDFLGGATGPLETIPRPLFAQVNMSEQEVDNLLKTEEGQKKIQCIIMEATQPPAPQFIVDACANFKKTRGTTMVTSKYETPASVPQLKNSPYGTPASVPQLENTPYGTPASIPQLKNSPYGTPASVPQLENTPYGPASIPQLENTPYGPASIPQLENTPIYSSVPHVQVPQMPILSNYNYLQHNSHLPNHNNFQSHSLLPNYNYLPNHNLLPNYNHFPNNNDLPNHNQSVAYSEHPLTPVQNLPWLGVNPLTQFGPYANCGTAGQAAGIEAKPLLSGNAAGFEAKPPPRGNGMNW